VGPSDSHQMLCQDIEIKYKHVMEDHSIIAINTFTPNSLPHLTLTKI